MIEEVVRETAQEESSPLQEVINIDNSDPLLASQNARRNPIVLF